MFNKNKQRIVVIIICVIIVATMIMGILASALSGYA